MCAPFLLTLALVIVVSVDGISIVGEVSVRGSGMEAVEETRITLIP